MTSDGCKHHPECLECPLDMCIHDRRPGGQRKVTPAKLKEINDLFDQKLLPSVIAKKLDLSVTTVKSYRVIQEERV